MGNVIHKNFILGIGFTLVVATISILLSNLPIFNKIGALAIAILIAIFYRQFFGYPMKYETGIQFSAKRLLRLAIILYGLKLNIFNIVSQGWYLLLLDAGVIIFTIFFMLFLNKLFKGDNDLGLLLGIGTGVCGAAAIAAVSPILKSREKDIGISVGLIALIGTVFSLIYTLLFALFPLGQQFFGVWSGASLHEIAHVILAADAGGETSLSNGLLTKLGRVFLLIPLCIILLMIVNRKRSKQISQKIDFPYFLIGFLMMSVINTFVPIPENIMHVIQLVTTLILIMAMVGIGLNVSFNDLKTKAIKPMLAMIITSLVLSVLTFFVIGLFFI